MTELADTFTELGISQYLQDFLNQGFDTWDTILDITESDFDALNVKLGHRRKLQRKIANSRGLSSDRALGSPSRNTPDDKGEEQKAGGIKGDVKEGSGSGPHGAKRKYRRHPKPDENAPERPPSAYVIFSNRMREELKGRNLSFTEIAKLVGENWQNLSPAEKEPYEQQAFSAKERHNSELAEYKTTNEYKDYSAYLVEFKARQANQQQVTDLDVAKRPKFEAHQSTASNGTTSSGASLHSEAPSGRMRVESSASSTNQWLIHENHPSPQLTGINQLSVTQGPLSTQGALTATSPTVLPGYRDSMFSAAPQTLAWRDGVREESNVSGQQLSRINNLADGRPSYTGSAGGETLVNGSLQHAHRTGRISHPPPLLSSESTAGRSSASSASNNTSAFFSAPRTPMEQPLDRALPIPSLFTQKSMGSFDNSNYLPPLRPPSLSPQTFMLGPQQLPNGIRTLLDHPNLAAAGRVYGAPITQQMSPADANDPRLRDYMSVTAPEDNILDPVSALLRAGEIVDRRSQAPP